MTSSFKTPTTLKTGLGTTSTFGGKTTSFLGGQKDTKSTLGSSPFNRNQEIQDYNLSENTLIQDLPDQANGHFFEVFYTLEKEYKVKPLEGVEAFDKKLFEIEENMHRSLTHTLTNLANEVDYANSVVLDFREELELSRIDLTTTLTSRQFPSPFILRYFDNLQKKKKNVEESISTVGEVVRTSVSLIKTQDVFDLLQAQFDAIVYLSSRLSVLQRKSIETEAKVSEYLRSRRGGQSLEMEELTMADSISLHLQEEYSSFQKERRRNLEKRPDPRPIDEQIVPEQKSAFSFKFGAGSGGGSALGKSTLGQGTLGKTNTSSSGMSSFFK